MSQFVGREDEIEALCAAYPEGVPRTCIVYGRRRVGVTRLVKEYCAGKRALYIRFPEGTEAELFSAVRDAVERFTGEPASVPTGPDSAKDLVAGCLDGSTVVVIDGTFSSMSAPALADLIDNHIAGTHNMLILCGTPVAPMTEVLNDPVLEGRFSRVVEVPPLTFEETAAFHPKMKPVDVYRCYLTVGGTPLYHSLMNKSDYASCVEKCFMGTFPRLCAEAEDIARRSAVPYAYCSAILTQIARGSGRPIDIANGQGISRQLCDHYLRKMESEGLIRRITPVADAPRKPMFTVSDPLLGFYHTVIRNNPDIVLGDRPGFGDVETDVQMFLELRFRKACYRFVKENFDCIDIGGWWMHGEDANAVNLAATVRVDGNVRTLLCDCKFRKGKVDYGALDNLLNRAALLKGPEPLLAMFSVSGFDQELSAEAEAEEVLLFGPKAVMGRK